MNDKHSYTFLRKKQTRSLEKNENTYVSVIAIISIMVCCLSALGYNSKISIEKEKIEVNTQSDFNHEQL